MKIWRLRDVREIRLVTTDLGVARELRRATKFNQQMVSSASGNREIEGLRRNVKAVWNRVDLDFRVVMVIR